eukprot:3133735-Prymnesium_polylepis.2
MISVSRHTHARTPSLCVLRTPHALPRPISGSQNMGGGGTSSLAAATAHKNQGTKSFMQSELLPMSPRARILVDALRYWLIAPRYWLMRHESG